jgi:hypothetical protein
MKLGNFRSFTNPNTKYSIVRTGKTIKDGGNGTNWECSCEAFKKEGMCKHLKCLFSYSKNDALSILIDSGFFSLTRDGKKYYTRLSLLK